ncbi:MAG: hypothetical protein HW403_1411, partial [Dehalococcoidia bacterium]|nr:hypothetical protein [Dehalococcoidia bacterium]
GLPLRGGIAYTDPLSSHAVAFSVMAALEYRRRTGVGQYIDLAQYEMGVTLMAESILDYQMNGRVRTPAGNEHPSLAPHNVYPCQGDDMWIAIAVTSDKEWEALRNAMGDPEWARDKRFGDAVSRWHHREEMDEKIREWTSTWDHYELMLTLQNAGVPAGAVFNSKELFLDPHLKARNFFQKITHPPRAGSLGTRLYPGVPWKMSEVPERAHDASPTLGQDNREVLGDLLGLSEGELAELESQDIIGTRPMGYALRPPRQVPLEELKKRGTMIERKSGLNSAEVIQFNWR